MERTAITVICLALVLQSLSCKQNQESPSSDYSVTKTEQSLSNVDIATCFKAVGLHYERFTCMIPKRTSITFSSKLYQTGQEIRKEGSGTTSVDKGLQNFFLFMKKDQDDISFTFASPTASVGCGYTSVEGYPFATYGWIPVDNLSREPKPIFIYAANINGGIEGFTAAENIDAQIAKYDFAMVIYTSIADPN